MSAAATLRQFSRGANFRHRCVFALLLLIEVAYNIRYHPLSHERELQTLEVPYDVVPLLLSAAPANKTSNSTTALAPTSKSVPAATSASNKTGSTVRRPKFLLHVGLPKTGTTFLQCSLCSQAQVTEPILLRDNWVFLGTCPYMTCGLTENPDQFLQHHITSFVTRTAEVHPSFAQKVRELRGRQRNVLVIFEGFDACNDEKIRALAAFLSEDDWDVRVLVAYRPLYQWLPSKYNSVTKRMDTLYEWPGRPIEGTNRVGEHWLPFDIRHGGNGNVIGDLMSRINSTQQHPAETLYRSFAPHFNVSVIPLHDLPPTRSTADPLLDYLFCTLLRGGTPHVCAAVRSGRIGADVQSNPSDVTHYDMLTTAAYEAGIINQSTTLIRWKVELKIQRRQERVLNRTVNDFPLRCWPNHTLAEFEKLSWRLERRMFPESNEEEALQKHRSGFAKKVASKSFCWIDTKKTLSDPSWRSFLKSEILA